MHWVEVARRAVVLVRHVDLQLHVASCRLRTNSVQHVVLVLAIQHLHRNLVAKVQVRSLRRAVVLEVVGLA